VSLTYTTILNKWDNHLSMKKTTILAVMNIIKPKSFLKTLNRPIQLFKFLLIQKILIITPKKFRLYPIKAIKLNIMTQTKIYI
jgi:hypothetical protein